MGAFNVELYRLGYRTVAPREVQAVNHTQRFDYESLHVVKVPCPGSCGSRCPNHYCPAHNGEAYKPSNLKR